MEIYDIINTRRSIRRYAAPQQEIPGTIVKRLLHAAMQAPSAGNQQPWHFLLVTDRKKLDTVPEFHHYCKMIDQVDLAIVVCGDPDGKKWPEFWPQDCSAAVQNILLAARAEGLGTVWTGVYPDKERIQGCRDLFNIPEHILPFAIIPVGWTEGEFNMIDRYNPEVVYQNEWGG